jgi:hypothetical protein
MAGGESGPILIASKAAPRRLRLTIIGLAIGNVARNAASKITSVAAPQVYARAFEGSFDLNQVNQDSPSLGQRLTKADVRFGSISGFRFGPKSGHRAKLDCHDFRATSSTGAIRLVDTFSIMFCK